MQAIKCGVPQGSILGLSFFILYINDLPNASELVELLIFADDTSIFYSHSNPNTLEPVLKNELKNIETWLRCNKLSVNVKKTTYLIFKPWQRKCNQNFSYSLGGQLLTQTNATNFLGVYIDEHLTWKDHISYLCKSIGMLFRSRFYLSSKTKLTLYYSLIYPYITWCNSTWSTTYVTNLNRIYCLQKTGCADYRAHSAPLFSKLKILDIYQVNSFQIAKFMYCYHNNLLPPLFFNLFFTKSQIHGYSTGTANNYRVHYCRTNLKKFTILYQGLKIWNSLPVTITSLTSFPNFKNKLLEFCC